MRALKRYSLKFYWGKFCVTWAHLGHVGRKWYEWERSLIYNETKVTFNIVGAELDTLIYKSLVECRFEVTVHSIPKLENKLVFIRTNIRRHGGAWRFKYNSNTSFWKGIFIKSLIKKPDIRKKISNIYTRNTLVLRILLL